MLFRLSGFNGYGQQLLHSLGADAFSPLNQRGRVKREFMPEELKTAEILPVRVFQQSIDN